MWGEVAQYGRTEHSIQLTWHGKWWPSRMGWSKAKKGDNQTTLNTTWDMVNRFCGVGQRGKERQEEKTRL